MLERLAWSGIADYVHLYEGVSIAFRYLKSIVPMFHLHIFHIYNRYFTHLQFKLDTSEVVYTLLDRTKIVQGHLVQQCYYISLPKFTHVKLLQNL